MASERVHWGSRLGFIMAAAGSAVGLGNLWKFPYVTWSNGGGTFVLVYLVAVLLLGIPIMMAEILVGRRAQRSPVPAFDSLGGKNWTAVGWLGVLAAGVILSYYSVIAGWSLRSFVQCMGWSIHGYHAPSAGSFTAFLADVPTQLGLTVMFSLATAFVVYRGVSGGIERTTQILMPILFLIMIYLGITAATMKGSGHAARMIFTPHLSTFHPRIILEAVGQSFFTLSLGLGAMITYGSYLDKNSSVLKSAASVVVLDTLVALVACFSMFSIIFSVPGMQDKVQGSTVGMLFVTLPGIFYTEMHGGVILAPLFYVLVAFAALTSTISLGEVLVSSFIDAKKWSRRRATAVATGMVFTASILAAVSNGGIEALSTFSVFHDKQGVMATLDYLAANWMLPLGGLGTTLFVGWKLKPEILQEELGLKRPTWLFHAWVWVLRVVAPAAIAAILVAVALGKDFS